MTELTADQRRSIADREQATTTLKARVATVTAASGDLVNLLERICETVGDRRQLEANRDALKENCDLALSYAKRVREAIG